MTLISSTTSRSTPPVTTSSVLMVELAYLDDALKEPSVAALKGMVVISAHERVSLATMVRGLYTKLVQKSTNR